MHILDKIVAHKIKELDTLKTSVGIKQLEQSKYFERQTNSLSRSIKQSNTGIISEFKRRSPSKPSINLEAAIDKIIAQYSHAGVSGISILTDEHFFGGSINDLTSARRLVNTALLRKEFIIDEYQIIEAKSIGADAILLITEILSKNQVATFAKLAKSLELDTILEIHTEAQLEKYTEDIDIVGVNNRDLTTFTVDPQHSIKMFDLLPVETVKISESGIHNIDTILMLKDKGYDGFLIGERFMKTDDPGKACNNFIKQLKEKI